jgi:hypothetical protein
MSVFIFLCLRWFYFGVRLRFSSSIPDRLVIVALILFVISIFLPWVAEQYIHFSWGFPRSLTITDLLFWSFMARENEKILLFGGFWFPAERSVFYPDASWSGLYIGWVLVLILQILTVAYSTLYSLHLRVSMRLREYHSTWLVILPLLTLASAVYQMFIQKEMMYRDLGLNPIRPDVGFVVAVLSTAVLLVTVLKAPEQSHLRTVRKALKRTLKRTWPVLVLLAIVALPVVAEVQARTNVSKHMTVEDAKDFEAIHGNSALWEAHFNRISSLASLFRARVVYNRPEYAYCELDVPVISYDVLTVLLTLSGYFAEEPTFMHLLGSE